MWQRQEPGPTLYAVRARQPLPAASEANRMRTTLPEIHQIAPTAGLKRRNSLSERPVGPDHTIEPFSRRSRVR